MSAIKLSNSVLLDSSSVKCFADFDNVLASAGFTSVTFTATEDCWLTTLCGAIKGIPNVGGGTYQMLMRKGDSVALSYSGGTSGYKAFGLK